jgi:hypothetical protein
MRSYCLRNERRELVVFVLHSHSFCSFFFIELSSFRRFYLTGVHAPYLAWPIMHISRIITLLSTGSIRQGHQVRRRKLSVVSETLNTAFADWSWWIGSTFYWISPAKAGPSRWTNQDSVSQYQKRTSHFTSVQLTALLSTYVHGKDSLHLDQICLPQPGIYQGDRYTWQERTSERWCEISHNVLPLLRNPLCFFQ